MAELMAEYVERDGRRFHVSIIGVQYWTRHLEYSEWHYRIRECSPDSVRYGHRDGEAYMVPRKVYAPSPYLPAPLMTYAPQVAAKLANEDIDTMLEREAVHS